MNDDTQWHNQTVHLSGLSVCFMLFSCRTQQTNGVRTFFTDKLSAKLHVSQRKCSKINHFIEWMNLLFHFSSAYSQSAIMRKYIVYFLLPNNAKNVTRHATRPPAQTCCIDGKCQFDTGANAGEFVYMSTRMSTVCVFMSVCDIL